MEALREGIGLRGYGQKDPKQEYKKEGFVIFGEMMGNIGRNVCEKLFHMQVQREEAPRRRGPQRQPQPGGRSAPRRTDRIGRRRRAARRRSGDGNGGRRTRASRCAATSPKSGRNDPCPCGSGKKYKKCHGAVATV